MEKTTYITDAALLKEVGLRELGLVISGATRLAGQSNRVYELSTSRGSSVIGRIKQANQSRLNLEAATIANCQARGLSKLPSVLYVGEHLTNSASTEGEQVAVMFQQKIDGVRLKEYIKYSSKAAATEALTECGGYLARVHQLHTDGYGPLRSDFTGASTTLGNWFIDDFGDKVRAAKKVDPSSIESIDEAFRIMESKRRLLDSCPSQLVHGDYSPSNILVSVSGEVVGVIDWESAKSGPSALDFGWWAALFDSADMPVAGLLDGYQRVQRIDRDSVSELCSLAVLRIIVGHFVWSASVGDKAETLRAGARLHTELSDWSKSHGVHHIW